MGIRYNADNDADGDAIGFELVCDYCEDPITDSWVNIALISDDGAVFFAHEGPCHDALERQSRARAKSAGWVNIKDALMMLAANLSRQGFSTTEVAVCVDKDSPSTSLDQQSHEEYTRQIYAEFEERVRLKNLQRYHGPETTSNNDDELPF